MPHCLSSQGTSNLVIHLLGLSGFGFLSFSFIQELGQFGTGSSQWTERLQVFV